MPRKSGSGLQPGISSTNAQKRKLFGVSQTELDQILATIRRFMTEYLDIDQLTTHQENLRTKVENSVKEAYPEIFRNDEDAVKMRHVRHYINSNHGTRRGKHLKELESGGGKRRRTEVVGFSGGGGVAMTMGEGAGPSSSGRNPREDAPEVPAASSPSGSITDGTPTKPPAKRGRPPLKNKRPSTKNATSPATTSASTTQQNTSRVEVVLQSRPGASSATQLPPPNHGEGKPSQDSNTGLKEVEQFLRTCKPSLVNLLDHLAYYGCVNADFLEYLAGRAARLEEEDFHRYLRNHFSKGQLEGRRDLTEMEVLVLTEGLLRYRAE